MNNKHNSSSWLPAQIQMFIVVQSQCFQRKIILDRMQVCARKKCRFLLEKLNNGQGIKLCKFTFKFYFLKWSDRFPQSLSIPDWFANKARWNLCKWVSVRVLWSFSLLPNRDKALSKSKAKLFAYNKVEGNFFVVWPEYRAHYNVASEFISRSCVWNPFVHLIIMN